MQKTPDRLTNNKLLKKLRLSKSYQFDNVCRNGSRLTSTYFKVYYFNNGLIYPRLGMIIPKKIVKKASDRNYFKRIIRERFRCIKEIIKSRDVVVIINYKGKIMIENAYSNLESMINLLINVINDK